MKILSSIVQWIIIAALGYGIYMLCKYFTLPTVNLTHGEVLFIALSFAFAWVEVFKIGTIKPFTCLKCMTGWFALLIGCLSIGWYGVLYLPVGLFIGAVFSSIKMRYL
jgi:hypothetical protein